MSERVPRQCTHCGHYFSAQPRDVARGRSRYCSRPCARRAYWKTQHEAAQPKATKRAGP